MKPYPQTNLNDKKQIFCYRISHFCRVHENSLEFWVVDFGSFWNLNLTPETAVDAILATIRLHNLLQFKSCESYIIPHFVDELEGGQVIHEGSWRQDNTQNMLPLPTHKQNNISKKCWGCWKRFSWLLLWTWSSSMAMRYISWRFRITKMHLLSVKLLGFMIWD